MRDISEWLDDLGLATYAEAFIESEIDLDALPQVTETDLKEIGVALRAGRKLLTATDALNADEPPAVPVAAAEAGPAASGACEPVLEKL